MSTEDLAEQQDGMLFPKAVIGASAGGLPSFKIFVKAIQARSGIAYMIIQHIDPTHQSTLAAILQLETQLPVEDFTDQTILMPDHIYIIPSGSLLVSKKGKLSLEDRPKSKKALNSISLSFEALADMYHNYAMGILLSGMGTDGTEGLKKIKDSGGVTFAESGATAKFPDMPNHASEAGVVDFVLPADEIPVQLATITKGLMHVHHINNDNLPVMDDIYYHQILSFLRSYRNVDFTYYKQSTIRRRILRRMLVNKTDTLEAYTNILENNKQEQDILYQDILIPVTSFFRDTPIFDNLCNKLFPVMFKGRHIADPVRIWVTGCSTGEEAYSMIICLHEYLGENMAGHKVQLFATDISEKAIQKARTGLYNKREMEGVSEERLKKYFLKTGNTFQIKKELRDLCIFAAHNFIKDPPFANMDLISCRNVLIYMESYLQRKAMATFHYALADSGILMLGKSETAANYPEYFRIVSKTEKLYGKKVTSVRSPQLMALASGRLSLPQIAPQKFFLPNDDHQKIADEILLNRYTPAAVLVNEQFEILQFRGPVNIFLELASGKASLNIMKMAREGLSIELRNAFKQAKESKEPVTKKDIPLFNGKSVVTLEIVPLLHTIDIHYLVVFKEETLGTKDHSAAVTATSSEKDYSALRIQRLEKEIAVMRENMRTIAEDHEAANEELQSANQELLSGSEELQSLNEELETSKEELQSTNEELMTVNQELYDRNEQYNQARLYAEAIVSTIREPLVVLNRDLRINTANQSFLKFFSLTPDEIRGRILFELENNKWDIAGLRTPLLNIQTGQLLQCEWEEEFVVRNEKKTLLLNAQPVAHEYGENFILLAFEDITLRKKEAARLQDAAARLQKNLHQLENFFTQAPALFCILKGPAHIYEFANPLFTSITGGKNLIGQSFLTTFTNDANKTFVEIVQRVFSTGESFQAKEMPFSFTTSANKTREMFFDVSCQAFKNDDNTTEGVLLFCYEVTAQVKSRAGLEKVADELEDTVNTRTAMLQQLNNNLENSNTNLEQFAYIASHDLQEPLRKIKTFITLLNQDHKAELSQNALSLLQKIELSSGRMSALIHDVLNYSRILQHEDHFVETDLTQIIRNVRGDYDLKIEELNARVEIDIDIPAFPAIPLQINQLFYNLVGNALKFRRKNVTPEIRIIGAILTEAERAFYPDLAPGDYCKISVADNGIGFDHAYAEQIFYIFQRLNNPKLYEGTGIGLALCDKIVKNHFGKIWGDGKLNEGAVFYVLLPLNHNT